MLSPSSHERKRIGFAFFLSRGHADGSGASSTSPHEPSCSATRFSPRPTTSRRLWSRPATPPASRVGPSPFIDARIRTGLRRRLINAPALETLDARVFEFLCEQLVMELDAGIADGQVSAHRPLLTSEMWGCVGRDTEYQWVDPMFSGPGWGGHLLMFEFPRDGLSRKVRKEVDQAVQDLQKSLSNLSHLQRHAIVRTAVDGLPSLT